MELESRYTVFIVSWFFTWRATTCGSNVDNKIWGALCLILFLRLCDLRGISFFMCESEHLSPSGWAVVHWKSAINFHSFEPCYLAVFPEEQSLTLDSVTDLVLC